MKRIISLTLAALMLVTLLLTATSCGMESITGYTRLRDHVISVEKTNGLNIALNDFDTYVVTISAVRDEENEFVLSICATKMSVPLSEDSDRTPDEEASLSLLLDGNSEKASLRYNALDGKVNATSTLYFIHYTGEDLIKFDSITGIGTTIDERFHRETATELCNVMLKALDTYTKTELDMSVTDLGFIALSDKYKYMDGTDEVETEENLGGILSPARLKLAGLMLLLGMGMVFLVLAILWLVLLIFKKVFYKDPAKEAKKPEPAKAEPSAPASVASAPAAPVTDDGALIAAITAAIAATIESDPALASQFAGGFRVVSFKPTTKSRNR